MAVVLGMVSCQTEPEGFGVNVAGEQDVNITVSLPEGTRANSALGAFDNIDMTQYDIRYIFQVFNAEGTQYKAKQVVYSDEKTVSFPVRLIPNRNYNFVVWADLVENGKTENAHYTIGESLEEIELNAWAPMDETRDAYTGCQKALFNGTTAIKVELTRPFAKMRVITTDMAELLGVVPSKANVAYTTAHYSSFNALAQQPENKNLTKTHDTFEIVSYDGEVGTLFTDYFFATAQQEVVKFDMEVIDSNEDSIVTRNFSTDIPVKRNYVTTIKGDILTMGDNITVEVKPDFANNGNIEDAPYYQVAVSNGFELVKALYEGREIIVLNHITVTAADVEAYLATRAAAAINPVLNLNGFTITIENNGTDALVNLNGGALTVEGDGAIESTAGALVEGATIVTEGATVEAEVAVVNGISAVKTGVEALAYVLANGGEFTFTENLAISEVLLASTTNPIVINGADFTLTSSATRAIRATVANANIVVNNLNIAVETERVGSNDIRGISIDNVTGVELTLNNCSVIFNHSSAHDWAYAVNVTGGSNHKVTVNGGTYNGANVINVRGSENTVIIKNATLTSLYRNNDMYFGACIYVVQHENSSVYAEGNTFNGDNAWAFNIGYTPVEKKNNTDNTKYVAAKVNDAYYYNIAEAIAAAEDGATIKVLQRHDCNVGATVPAGKTLTIDLNGKTVRGKTNGKTNPQDLFLVKGNLTVNNGTITTEHVGENLGWSAMTTIFNITGGGVVNLNGVTAKNLGGSDMGFVAHLNNWGEVTLNVENSTLESNYVAVRVFNSGYDKNNVTIKNSTLKGGSYAFWVHNYTVADFGTEEKAEAQKALLNFDIFNGTNTFIGKNETPIRYGMTNAIYTEASEIVSTSEELIAALKKNASVVNLLDGEYEMPQVQLQGKSLTIKGSKDVVIDASKIDARNQFVTGATLAFEGVTINFGKELYMGFANTASLKYKNCHINGLQFLFGENVEFENCTFNSNGAEHSVWTYGVKNVSFTDCDFTYGDRCVNCYSDNDVVGGKQTVNFTNCTFTTENTASEGAVEINSCFFSVGIEVNLKGCTAPAYGEMAWVSRWDSTNGAKTTINIK